MWRCFSVCLFVTSTRFLCLNVLQQEGIGMEVFLIAIEWVLFSYSCFFFSLSTRFLLPKRFAAAGGHCNGSLFDCICDWDWDGDGGRVGRCGFGLESEKQVRKKNRKCTFFFVCSGFLFFNNKRKNGNELCFVVSSFVPLSPFLFVSLKYKQNKKLEEEKGTEIRKEIFLLSDRNKERRA